MCVILPAWADCYNARRRGEEDRIMRPEAALSAVAAHLARLCVRALAFGHIDETDVNCGDSKAFADVAHK